jgi:hypothetical protein
VLLGACAHGATPEEPGTGAAAASRPSLAGPSSRPASQPASQPATVVSDLYVDPASYPFEDVPKLLQRIRASAHGYFRFVNHRFAQRVCEWFADAVRTMPTVNLHGDAHLEQYVVTDRSRGLTDFDDSSTGPPVIDLVRMATSIRLAAQWLDWTDQSDAFVQRFLAGYTDALEDPELDAPIPELARLLRQDFVRGRAAFLAWAQSVIEPVDDATRADMQRALEPYVERMLEADNGVSDPAFFIIREAGLLRLGIGSALDEKYLLRVRGPSEAEDDDVILEAKEVRDLQGVTCLDGRSKVDPFRILLAQSRLAYTPHQYVGYLRHHDVAFWIHSWDDHYQELRVPKMLERPQQMSDVLYDVGVQLGRGHPNQIASPLDAELRAELRAWVKRTRPQLLDASRDLAAAIQAAWERFRSNTDQLALRLGVDS